MVFKKETNFIDPLTKAPFIDPLTKAPKVRHNKA